jgi:hypothetical protein
VAVAADGEGAPTRVRVRGRWLRVDATLEEWRLVDEWWREQPIRRRYFRLVLEDGRLLTVFCDLVDGAWYTQQA